MDKNMKDKILEVANYIVENNATILSASEHFNISPSSVKKYINNKDKLQSIDIELYKKVKLAQERITLNGQINGGKIGSREGVYSVSKEKIICIMDEMIDKDLTLEEAEKIFGIPSSTIYDGIERSTDLYRKSMIYDLYGKHKSQNKKDKNFRKYN